MVAMDCQERELGQHWLGVVLGPTIVKPGLILRRSPAAPKSPNWATNIGFMPAALRLLDLIPESAIYFIADVILGLGIAINIGCELAGRTRRLGGEGVKRRFDRGFPSETT